MPVVQMPFVFSPNIGELPEPDARGRSGSTICGAFLLIDLNINGQREISDVRFRVAGCSCLVRACAAMSDSIRGLSTAEAAVWAQSMTNARSGLPGEVVFGREHCAGLAAQALLNAIQRYSDARREEWNGEDALICSCFGVSQHEIELKIREGHLETIEAVTAHCKAGGGCNSCYPLIQDILDQAADRL